MMLEPTIRDVLDQLPTRYIWVCSECETNSCVEDDMPMEPYFCDKCGGVLLPNVDTSKMYNEAMGIATDYAIKSIPVNHAELLEGFVYLMMNTKNRLVKIGITKDINTRTRTIASFEGDLKLIYHDKSNTYSAKEKHLHKKYGDKRVSGEWFSLSGSDIEYCKSYISGSR